MRFLVGPVLALTLAAGAPSVWGTVCCLPDGTCRVMSEQECLNREGCSWEGATTCEPDPCNSVGACCVYLGGYEVIVCRMQSGYQCSQNGPGGWLGPGTDCTPDPCHGPTPCCLLDQTCEWLLVRACESRGGIALGENYDCDPNPCPVPYGACCYSWGEECTNSTEEQCSHLEGEQFMGDGTRCESLQCADRQGACCLEDGTCLVVPASQCSHNGEEYAGDGTECTGDVCAPVATLRMTWGRIKSRY